MEGGGGGGVGGAGTRTRRTGWDGEDGGKSREATRRASLSNSATFKLRSHGPPSSNILSSLASRARLLQIQFSDYNTFRNPMAEPVSTSQYPKLMDYLSSSRTVIFTLSALFGLNSNGRHFLKYVMNTQEHLSRSE